MPAPAATPGSRTRLLAAAALLAPRLERPARLLAGALRDVFPVGGIAVGSGLPGARMARGAAIVLPRLGDAVALLARRRRVRGARLRGDRGRDEPREGGTDEQ